MSSGKLAFSFSKKAEPKRTVEALAKKKDDGRVAISGVEAGQVTVDGPVEAAKQLTIACKNPLEAKADKARPPGAAAPARAAPPAAGDDAPGGLLPRGAPGLSAEDAEALNELKREAGAGGGADGEALRPQVAPILMREGSKKVRNGAAPEASKDMFDAVPVEAFGEALLRGMGYDPAKHSTKPVIRDKLRDTHLGLGAAPLLPSEKLPPKAGKRAAAAAPAAPAAGGAAAGAAGGADASAAAAPANGAGDGAAKRRRQDAAPGDGEAAPEAKAAPAAPARSAAPAASAAPWPSRGLLVRLRGGEATTRELRGVEAVVLEVDAASALCRVKARVDGVSRVLEGLPAAELAPMVGAECQRVRILRGPHAGREAALAERGARRGAARVRLDGAELEVPMADLCEFIAPRR